MSRPIRSGDEASVPGRRYGDKVIRRTGAADGVKERGSETGAVYRPLESYDGS
jgi:hypothetical protein